MKNPTASEELSREILMKVPDSDFETALELFTGRLGFRIDMIFPADSPSVAVISGHGTSIRLEKSEPPAVAGGLTLDVGTMKADARSDDGDKQILINRRQPPATAGGSDWITGRAGMEYRDLITGRLGGQVIASHIRIPNGGEVADYVHYHKVDFQMIYCVAGSIKVVYEDQGGPFWLQPGDCVLQPSEIRHRVLEAAANSEVVEIGMPAVHETWADHEMNLPTAIVSPDRKFSGQRFVRHIAADSPPFMGVVGDFESHHTEISSATEGMAEVFELRSRQNHSIAVCESGQRSLLFYFVRSGRLILRSELLGEYTMTAGDSIVVPAAIEYELNSPANSEILCVFI